MTFGERKDRILMVITVITALFFAGTYLAKLMMVLFSSLYIQGFPLSAQHMVAPVMLTSGVFILFSCLKYIYLEYFTFAQYGTKLGIAKERMDHANESYKALLNMVRFCLALTAISFFVISFTFSSMRLLLIMVILFVLFLLMIVLWLLWIKKRRFQFNVFWRTVFWNKNAALVVAWVFIASFLTFVALALVLSNITKTLKVTFDTKDQVAVQIDFLNTIPDLITITSYNEDADAKIQDVIRGEDFSKAFVEEISKSNSQLQNSFEQMFGNEEKNQSNYSRNEYKYMKSVDLTPYLREGKNFIEITFVTQGWSGRELEHRLVNEISKTKERVVFTEKELSVDL